MESVFRPALWKNYLGLNIGNSFINQDYYNNVSDRLTRSAHMLKPITR